jgi:hypothetical protein
MPGSLGSGRRDMTRSPAWSTGPAQAALSGNDIPNARVTTCKAGGPTAGRLIEVTRTFRAGANFVDSRQLIVYDLRRAGRSLYDTCL